MFLVLPNKTFKNNPEVEKTNNKSFEEELLLL